MATPDEILQQVHELSQALNNLVGGQGMGAGVGAREEQTKWKEFLKEYENFLKKQEKLSEADAKASEKFQQEFFKRANKSNAEMWKAVQETNSAIRETNEAVRRGDKTSSEYVANITTSIERSTQLTSSLFQQAVDQMSSYKDIQEQMIPVINKALEQKKVGGGYQTAEEVFALQERAKAERELLAIHAQQKELYQNGEKTHKDYIDKVEEAASALGVSNDATQKIIEGKQEYVDQIHDTNEALGQASASLAGADGKLSTFGVTLASATYWGKQLASEFADFTQSVAQTGGQLENFVGSFLYGMSGTELSELQGQYRQTTLAMRSNAGAIDSWEKQIADNTFWMSAWTGGVKESTQVHAHLLDVQRTLGDVSGDTAGFLSHQQKMFKNWNRVFGLTVDQFQAMNEQLLQSQNVRTQLYKMDQQRRSAYFKDLQLTYQRLRSQGLLHEQAMQTVEALSEIGGQDAKTRLEQAAKLQAVMGAQGMGRMGAEAAQLLRGGLRGEESQQRFTQLMGQASKQISETMSRGFTSELVTGQMIEQAGLEKYLGPQSTFADVEIQQGKALNKNVAATQDLTSELTQLRKQLETGNNTIKSLFAGGTQMLGNAFGGVTGAAANFIGGTLAPAAITGIIMRGGIKKALAGLGGAAGTAATGGSAAASTAATASAATAGRSAAGGGILGRMGGMAKGLGGGLLKSLPFIGTGLSAAQAAKHFSRGDVGAGLMSTAGAGLSLIPGLGTIGKLGLTGTRALGATGAIAGTAGSEMLAGERGTETQSRTSHVTGLLERNNEILEQIAANTNENKEASKQISQTEQQRAKQEQAQRERDEQQKNRETLNERRERAKQGLSHRPPIFAR